jgi:hypothetical protein
MIVPIILSLPLYMQPWTLFDDLVGHRRRYEPKVLAPMLAARSLVVENAAYGIDEVVLVCRRAA